MPVADMPTTRSGLACGTLRNKESGAVEKVLAVGGSDYPNWLTTVEVYDVGSNTWSDGVNLPVPLEGAATVPFEDTFLVIGGEKRDPRGEKGNDALSKWCHLSRQHQPPIWHQ